MTISEKIRLTRQQKKMSQTELAQKANVNLKSLSRYELGTTIPPADTLKNIADVLDVSIDYLVSDDNKTTQVKDTELFKKFSIIQDMEGDTKNMIMNFLDLAIRDFKTKQTYSSN